MRIYYGSFIECGPRKNNGDYIAAREIPGHNRSVFVLYDGMGGHDCGEVPSKLVAEHICGYWVKNPKRKDSKKKRIYHSIGKTNPRETVLTEEELCDMLNLMRDRFRLEESEKRLHD